MLGSTQPVQDPEVENDPEDISRDRHGKYEDEKKEERTG